MSARERRVVLAPKARADFRDILRYTARRWGSAQRDAYRQTLFRGFAHLARYPLVGQERPEYGQDTRSYPIGSHVAIYEASETELLIARIIHERRDLTTATSE
jgi:toxin ParE1/3/4